MDLKYISDITSLVTAIASLSIAVLAFALSYQQYRSGVKSKREALAKEAVDNFFSFELAEIRFRIFDIIVKCALAAKDPESDPQYCDLFGLDVSLSQMPSRHDVVEPWSRSICCADDEHLRDLFKRDSAVLMSSFDAIFRAAAESKEASDHVQLRMGRLIVWWLLLWPKLFDHTNSFMGRSFIATAEVHDQHPEDRRNSNLYTELWWTRKLWSKSQWSGAIENFETITQVHFPESRWRKMRGNDD